MSANIKEYYYRDMSMGGNTVNKKVFTILLTIFFVAIAAFHFTLNFMKRNEPPSTEWSKEVLISTGNVQSNPSLIKYKDNYLVAHSDGDKIKVLSVDKLGKKLEEKTFNANGAEPLSTNILTDGKEIYVYWTISEGGEKTVYNVRLDDELNILQESRIHGADEIISIGESIIALNYKDKIGVTDLSTGKSYSLLVEGAEALSGARNRAGYIVSFKQKSGEFKYFTIISGEVSKIKAAGKLEDVSSIAYVSSTLISDDSFAYLMMEYRNKGEFGGTRVIKFSLKEEGKFEVNDFKVNKSKEEISNISPYYSAGAAKFLARKEVPYDKKHYYEDIVEYNITDSGEFISLSRSKELSMYAVGVEDTAIFCDVVGKDMFNIYMTSKNEEFKKVHNNLRFSDVKLALMDTVTGLLYSFVYILPYGALWVIPTIGVISVYSILEFKLSLKKKKIGFALIYLTYFIFKSIGIGSVTFKRFGRLLPEFMNFQLSLAISLAISLLCGIYAYGKYSKGHENNIGAISISVPMVYDSILTLMVVVPFII
jgi:hypothetical protein